MAKNVILLNLPRDLGDCLFCVPAIRAVVDYVAEKNADLVCIGGARNKDWVETLSGLSLPFHDVKTAPVPPEKLLYTHLLLNFDFYDQSLGEKYPGLPLYQPTPMEVVTEDRTDFGAGAVVGQKHIFTLLEDCLTDAGILPQGAHLPLPALPEAVFDPAAVQAVQNKFNLPEKFGLLVPVCAANRPFKRWQNEKFIAVAKNMQANGIIPVLIGGPSPDEKKLCADLQTGIGGDIRNICGETGLAEIAALASRAVFTLGNDTGPTHIAAASGKPVFTLYGYYNDPATWQSLTPHNTAAVIHGKTIQGIEVEDVLSRLPIKPASQTPKPAAQKAAQP